MAINFTNTTFATTYKDDFKDSDNYHRILFNAGRALQARELTQLQTIIQAEIGRFARNIFNEGAVVSPGGVTVNNRYEYIKLVGSPTLPEIDDILYVSNDTSATYASSSSSPIVVKVLRTEEADGADPATIYVQYIKTSSALAGTSTIRVGNGWTLVDQTTSIPDLTTAATDAAGRGTLASVANGEYFTKNHFVFAEQQSFLLSKYSSTPTTDIGFLVTEDIVTVSDTTALYDNQGAVPNEASPGADRYRIRLTLTSRDLVDSADHFVFIARVVQGLVSTTSTGWSEYNKINDLMAIRTKEESGDYVAKPFNLSIKDLNDSQLSAIVEPGIAYVDGYRLETPLTELTIQKAQDSASVTDGIVAKFGNYVIQDTGSLSNNGLPNFETFAQVNLRDKAAYGATFGGSTIGTARVRASQRYGSDIRHYLLDVKMNPGETFSSVRSFGPGPGNTDYVNVQLIDSAAVLQETGNNSLLFPLSHPRPIKGQITIGSGVLRVQQRKEFAHTSTTLNISADQISGSYLTLTDPGDWIISKIDGWVGSESVTFSLTSATEATITGMTSGTYELIYYVYINTPSSRAKTLTERTLTKHWQDSADSDGFGLTWITLDRADVKNILAIKQTDSDGVDLSGFFTFDNGQRDNFYDRGRLIQKPGFTIPTGDVYVKFQHYQPDDGHYFTATSYPDYEDIPTYRKNNGETISLRDVIDFRSLVDSTGVFPATTSADYVKYMNFLPENGDVITVTSKYYLPRKDKISIKRFEADVKTNRAQLSYVTGVPSFDPVPPKISDGAMALYDIDLNPYTLNDSDLSIRSVTNKGYTMKDIARIERRIERLEETTTLNLLEANTANILVLDSAGNPRTKSGFLADNFNTLDFAELSPRYRATIDQSENTLGPLVFRKNVRLLYDSDNTRNTNINIKRSGDILTLDYTHTLEINQVLATETMNINPFAVITQNGTMVISPASDEWVETRYAADKVIDGGTVSNVGAGQLRQALQNGWTGSPGQSIITASRIITTQVNDVVIDVQVIPWMRSRRISFKVNGLRPETRYFPYFNGTDVSLWCRGGTLESVPFTRFSTTSTDDGNLYNSASSHPDGNNILLTDTAGNMEGEFFLPSTPTVRFRTGTSEFKLMDISGGIEDDAISISRAQYTSSGVLETRERTLKSTRNVTVGVVPQPPPPPSDGGGWSFDGGGFGGVGDPLAQSFFVDRLDYPNGMFLTKVGIFIATIDTEIPVRCEIVEMENGTPTNRILPGAVVSKIPTAYTTVKNITTIRNNETQFEFDEPIYLSPGREYAVVLKAETTKYNVYVAKTYDFVIGTTDRRVNKQPTLGSLFQSQNASTWTPDQTRDLMFKLYRATFNTTGTIYLENGFMPYERLQYNPLRVDNGDSDVTFAFEGHGFAKNDLVNIILPNSFADSFGGIADSAIGDSALGTNNIRSITAVDWTGFKIGALSSLGSQTATSNLVGGGADIIVEQQAHFDEFYPVVQTLLPEFTSVSAKAKLTNAGSYAGTRRTGGSGSVAGTYSLESQFKNINLNEMNYNTRPKVILTRDNETRAIADGYLGEAKSATIQLQLSTLDTAVSPIVDLQRASLILTENVIDEQDSASAANAPLNFVAETDPTGGTIAAKHITKQVTLEQPAVGLKILLGANRPSSATIRVYYKTGNSEDVLNDISWTLISPETDLSPDNDKNIFREYEYLPGGIGGNLPSFTKYQVKIVMGSTNTSTPPRIKDLRIIALAI